MVKTLLTYFKEGSSYSGIEVVEQQGIESYNLLELNRKKGELFIVNEKKVEEFSVLKKDSPVFFIINTSQVLVKQIKEVNNTQNLDALVNHAFPNLDLNNFYYQVIQPEKKPIVTICKKEYVDAQINKLKEMKIQVFEFSLGISAIEEILPYANFKKVYTSKLELTLEDLRINSFAPNSKSNTEEYLMNGVKISTNYLLVFSNIIGYLSNSPRLSNFDNTLDILKNEFWNKRLFTLITKASLSLLLLILLSNFLFYNFYFNNVNDLQETMSYSSAQKEQITQLKELVDKKQERVETLSAFSNSKASFFLDLIAYNIPNTILLDNITYQPITKSIRDKKPILLEKNTLLISGISKDTKVFSLWIETIEKQDWVASVETLDYDYVSKETSNFLIKINIDEAR